MQSLKDDRPATPDEAQQLSSLTESIKLLRERRRKLTLTISKLVERHRLIKDRLRTRARRQEQPQ